MFYSFSFSFVVGRHPELTYKYRLYRIGIFVKCFFALFENFFELCFQWVAAFEGAEAGKLGEWRSRSADTYRSPIPTLLTTARPAVWRLARGSGRQSPGFALFRSQSCITIYTEME